MRIAVIGNCQAHGIASLLQAMSGDVSAISYDYIKLIPDLQSGRLNTSPFVEADVVLAHSYKDKLDILATCIPDIGGKIKLIPSILFSAYHPDFIRIHNQGKLVESPIGGWYNSSLAFYGWKNGLSAEETINLYSEDVYNALGFFNYWNSSCEFLAQLYEISGLPLGDSISRWTKHGCFMHTVNHPKLFALADVARAALAREGVDALPNIENYLWDNLADAPCWPVYPEIGKRLGISGMNTPYFKKWITLCAPDRPVSMLSLAEFVQQSFGVFRKYKKEDLHCAGMENIRYQELGKFLQGRHKPNLPKVLAPTAGNPETSAKKGSSPYQGLPDYQFWRRAIERCGMKDVDPVVRSGLKLNRADKVATAGSCFAQHISGALQKQGFNYCISEKGMDIPAGEAQRRNFGVFSARFGNIYSARQLIQLFDRAYGAYAPTDRYWVRGDGKFVDPFRPQVEPDGFTSVEDLESDRSKHFSCVREMFDNLDVFVFTLGLTEAWRSSADGAVYPLAPGVVAGEMDPSAHEFVNFGVSDVVTDMQSFIERLLGVNPQARMLLTVSPVPLVATYEDRHVLVSTTYSKSVLRVAAEEIVRRNAMCEYFPSYEIITGNYTKGEYFEGDFRSVKPEGVEHVMRLFLQHYSSEKIIYNSSFDALDSDLMRQNALLSEIVCDEEAIQMETEIELDSRLPVAVDKALSFY